MWISVSIGIVISGIIILSADAFAVLLSVPKATPVLKLFGIAIPLYISLYLILGAFRSYESILPRIILNDVVYHFGSFLLVSLGVIFGIGLTGLASLWIAPLIVAVICGLGMLYHLNSVSTSNDDFLPSVQDFGMMKDFVVFSLPLLFANISWQIFQHTDTILIGYFKSSEFIGYYDSAFTISRVLLLFSWGVGFLFLPIMTDVLQSESSNAARIYTTITKWTSFLTAPVFIIVVFFPSSLIHMLFGPSYSHGKSALIVLSIGFMSNVISGQTKETIIAAGQTNYILYGNSAALGCNILLNIILIPIFGITGAAIASMATYLVVNSFYVYTLYRTQGIQPFSKTHLVPLSFGSILISAVCIFWPFGEPESWLAFLILAMVSYLVQGVAIIISGGLQDLDKQLLRQLTPI